jgi:hypothetical protein
VKNNKGVAVTKSFPVRLAEFLKGIVANSSKALVVTAFEVKAEEERAADVGGEAADAAKDTSEDVKYDVLEFPLAPLQPFNEAEFLKELNNPQEAEEFAEEDKKADLVVAQYGGSPSELSGSREEIERLKVEVQRLTDADAVSSRKVDNVDFGASAVVMDELTMELMATNEHLEKATAARMKAEMELAFVKAEDANALRAEVESIRAELKVAKEVERRLEDTTTEAEELRAQLAVVKVSDEKAAKVNAELNKNELRAAVLLSTCATSGEGLYEGLDWLSSHIANKA